MTGLHRLVQPSINTTLVGLCLSGGLFTSAAAKPQPQEIVTVLMVNNGQEVLVESAGQGRTVRLSCLQAPRAHQQPWARQATAALSKLLPEGTQVTFELRARDVYGRQVGRLLKHTRRTSQSPAAENTVDIAEALISQGHAFVHDGYLGRCDDLPYKRIEAKASAERLGVWRPTGGLARPWDQQELERIGGIAP